MASELTPSERIRNAIDTTHFRSDYMVPNELWASLEQAIREAEHETVAWCAAAVCDKCASNVVRQMDATGYYHNGFTCDAWFIWYAYAERQKLAEVPGGG